MVKIIHCQVVRILFDKSMPTYHTHTRYMCRHIPPGRPVDIPGVLMGSFSAD